MQIVHNLQCRIIFADFIKERLVRALHVCRAQATKHQSHIVFASRGRSVHRVDGPAGHIGIDAVHFGNITVNGHDIAVFRDIRKFSAVKHLRRLIGEHGTQGSVLASGRRHEFNAS